MPQEVLQMHLQRIIMMQIRQKQEEQRRVSYFCGPSHFFNSGVRVSPSCRDAQNVLGRKSVS